MRSRVRPSAFMVESVDNNQPAVYFGKAHQPDDKFNQMTAERQQPTEDAEKDDCIVIEMVEIAEVLRAKLKNEDVQEKGVFRHCLQLADARKLCCALINALDDSGDSMAKVLHQVLTGKLDEYEADTPQEEIDENRQEQDEHNKDFRKKMFGEEEDDE